jgi:hypothetical protein
MASYRFHVTKNSFTQRSILPLRAPYSGFSSHLGQSGSWIFQPVSFLERSSPATSLLSRKKVALTCDTTDPQQPQILGPAGRTRCASINCLTDCRTDAFLSALTPRFIACPVITQHHRRSAKLRCRPYNAHSSVRHQTNGQRASPTTQICREYLVAP